MFRVSITVPNSPNFPRELRLDKLGKVLSCLICTILVITNLNLNHFIFLYLHTLLTYIVSDPRSRLVQKGMGTTRILFHLKFETAEFP